MQKRDPILVAFGQNVSELRKKRELTQEALAERANLTAQGIITQCDRAFVDYGGRRGVEYS